MRVSKKFILYVLAVIAQNCSINSHSYWYTEAREKQEKNAN